ncbi:unnamed protein product [Cochlearia groenlandica]
MWMVFGGKPLKFSSREFALTTCLPCGQFPDATTINQFKNNESDNMLQSFSMLQSENEKDNELFPSTINYCERVTEESNEPLAQGQKAIVQTERGKRKRTRSEKLQDPLTPGSRLRPLFASTKKVVPYHPLTQPNIEDFETFKKALEKEGEDEADMAKITEEQSELIRIKYARDAYVEFVRTHDKLFDNADAVKTKRKGKFANEDGEASKDVCHVNYKLVLEHLAEHRV